jgi:hypothetical protein
MNLSYPRQCRLCVPEEFTMSRSRYKFGDAQYPDFITCRTDRDHQLWQERRHPRVITDEAMMWQKLEYIHNNPVRRGYVDDRVHWRYSSARNYATLPALVPVIVDWL